MIDVNFNSAGHSHVVVFYDYSFFVRESELDKNMWCTITVHVNSNKCVWNSIYVLWQ